MTATEVMESLSILGVRVIFHAPEIIRLVSDAPEIPPEAVAIAKPHKSTLIQFFIDRKNVSDDDDLDEITTCSCGRDCDTETFFGEWRCRKCDPQANHRRTVTDRLLRHRDQILKRYKIPA